MQKLVVKEEGRSGVGFVFAAFRQILLSSFGQRRFFPTIAAVTILLTVGGAPLESHGQTTDGHRTLYLATSNQPPVVNAVGSGYLDRILLDVGQRTRLTFDIRKLPAARGLALANTGVLDGEVARTDAREDQYPHLIRVPEPVIDIVVAGVYTRDDIQVDEIEDFRKYRVGRVRGWKYVENMLSSVAGVTVTRTEDQLMDMLNADRLDIAVLTVAPARLRARERGMINLKITNYAIRKDMYLYLHESKADLVGLIDSAIRAMKADGRHDAILKDYRFENQ
ncbi:substrate-binding periplasmic protein [Granulosicoccus sp. 3-233]|uniref:substrate-binding periplasmic protein n=1 Tax=Granulosicoccus sp. 3-233 TaxID=3417969 RepID=UPI003D328353